MSEEKKVVGRFRYEQDSKKRFHRFKIETDEGITGSVYVPKDKKSMPKKLIEKKQDFLSMRTLVDLFMYMVCFGLEAIVFM